MKKILSFAVALFAIGAISAQSIPDGGFEVWNTTLIESPNYFNTSNLLFNSTISSSYVPNVTQTAGKYGSYGVQIASVLNGTDTLPGLIVDANVGRNGLDGGIPYAQKPTGLRFWYKYTTAGVDTGAVFVMFKLAGNIIDSFLLVIPSSQSTSTYTLRSYYTTHPLTQTPDTVIFGAVSSLAIFNNQSSKSYSKGVVPGSTLVIDSVTFTGVGSNQPAKLNGNFENWNTDTAKIPPGWYINYPGITQTSDRHAGSYALQVSTVNSINGGAQPGQISTGYYPNCHGMCHELGGFPYTTQIDTLQFWYKYTPVSADTAAIYLNFVKNGQNIYGTNFIVFNNVTSWTYATVPFNLAQMPDTVMIDIISSAHNHDTTNAQYTPYLGSTFKIDNLTFTSQKASLGLNELLAKDGIRVYPNPAKNQINVDLSNISGSLQTITIYDMSGRVLNSQNYSGVVRNSIESIDISSLSSGIYLIEVRTANGNFYQKISKQ